MPKIYKITQAQMVVLSEHIKSEKKLVEGVVPFTSEPPTIQTEEPGATTTELSPEAQAYYNQQNKEPLPPEKEEEKVMDEETPVDANSAVDPNLISTLVNQELQKMGINPGHLKQASSVGSTAQIQQTNTPTHSSQNRQTVNTPANPQPTGPIMGEEQPVSNQETAPALTSTNEDTYKTEIKVTDVDTYNLTAQALEMGNSDVDISVVGELTVEWTLIPDAKPWGVRSLETEIHKISGYLHFSYVDDQGQKDSKELPFTAEGWEIIDNIKIGSTIYPSTIEMDWQKKTLTVE